MDPFAILIIAVGLPLSLVGFFLTRAYCRALAKADKPRPRRASYRADVINGALDKQVRDASDAAVIAAGIVGSCVIHS